MKNRIEAKGFKLTERTTVMSDWQQYQMTERIREILRSVSIDEGLEERYHTGRPFLTAHQIAIEFAERFPDIMQRLYHEYRQVGGEGHGTFSPVTYISRQLARRIRQEECPDIELRVLSRCHIEDITFDDRGSVISPTDPKRLTMYRLIRE